MPFPALILMACVLAVSSAQPSGGFIAFPCDWYTRVTDVKLPLAQKGPCFIDIWGNIETLVASGERSELPGRFWDQITAAGIFDKMIVFDTNVHMSAFGKKPGSVDLFKALYQKLAAKVYQPLPVPVCDAAGLPPFGW